MVGVIDALTSDKNKKDLASHLTGGEKPSMLTTRMTQQKSNFIKDLEQVQRLADIVLSGEVQRYVSMVKAYCVENGLYKQKVKKLINTLIELCATRQKQLSLYEYDALFYYIVKPYPSYFEDFYNEGHSVMKSLQARFVEKTDGGMHRVFTTYRDLFSSHGVSHSELTAAVYTMTELYYITNNILHTVARVMQRIAYGYTATSCINLRDYEGVANCSRELLRTVGVFDGVSFDDSELDEAKSIAENLQIYFLKGRPLTDYLRVIINLSFDYVDYCVAKILEELVLNRSLSDKTLNEIRSVMGDDTEAFVEQLNKLEVSEDADTIDIVEGLHKLPKDETDEHIPLVMEFMTRCAKKIEHVEMLARLEARGEDEFQELNIV